MKITTDTVVPFDEANQPDSTTPLKATRRLIKVDFSALQMDDEEEDELSDGELAEPERTPRPNPWHRTGTGAPQAPPAPLTREEYHHYCDTALECTLPPQSACRVTAGCRIL
uniref:Uncharacterized protein n=1 Tax=Graphocephala atropunctata TaxID=36148 RepID=A0A1B6MKP6_9HEMI